VVRMSVRATLSHQGIRFAEAYAPIPRDQSKVVRDPRMSGTKGPDGFQIDQALTGLDAPRTIITAPNGDLSWRKAILAESVASGISGDGKVGLQRAVSSDLDHAMENRVFLSHWCRIRSPLL